MEFEDLDILQGYTLTRETEEGDGRSRTLYWLDDRGRYHRSGDYPAVIKLIDGKVVERTWYKHGVEHRGLGKKKEGKERPDYGIGRPTFYNSVTGEERYVNDGRPYDVNSSIDEFYRYFETEGITNFERKIIYDTLIDRYFLETAIHKKDVVEYAQARLEQINTTQACHAVNVISKDNLEETIQETSSSKSDYVFRFEEGSSEPLFNNTLPKQNPGRVHNYVIIFAPRENDNPLPESHIEFLAMNLVEVRSKHAHILLSKFAPRFRDFKYLISGECIFNPKSGKFSVNIQSGMNWQLNLSRFSEQDLQGIKDRMKSDIINGNLEVPSDLADYAYVLLQDILRGRGPKNDLFGAIAELYFSQCLGYEVGVYETKTFRGQTKEDIRILKQWCEQGVGIRIFDNKKVCDSNPTGGRDFCSTLSLPGFSVKEETTTKTSKKEKEIVDYNSLTVIQLKELLDDKDIVYPPRARKNQLIELLKGGV